MINECVQGGIADTLTYEEINEKVNENINDEVKLEEDE